jgi:hypothetical protein
MDRTEAARLADTTGGDVQIAVNATIVRRGSAFAFEPEA